MELDPELLKQLTETFRVELDEQLQVITDGLLFLEKADSASTEFTTAIDNIFRAAHNIKGTSRGIGVNNVSEIAHRIESLFSAIRKQEIIISPTAIDLCLEGVDAMRSAMKSFIDKTELNFDLNNLVSRLTENPKNKTENIDKPVEAVKKTKTLESPAHTDNTIRVSLSHLDQVSALMEEIQVNKIAIDEYYEELTQINSKLQKLSHDWKQAEFSLENSFASNINETGKIFSAYTDGLADVTYIANQLHKNMRPRMDELTILTNGLQTEVRMLRLIPASELLQGFPRVVRDLAHELNKKVELEIKGEDVKLDKVILAGLKDPLTHLLRNAIDHGIETANIRKKAGKPETGKILINITEEGGQIVFAISDDGAGMDVDKIASKAESRNLIAKTELETMSQNDLLELIFLPGFSTRENITDVSGRGVGLDVVRENVTALKGSVSVNTTLSKGSTFLLRMPLTLSSERGIMLSCGGNLYAIPVNSIERVLMLNADDIISVSASQAIMLDKHPVPLRSLADILNIKATESVNSSHSAIVLKMGWQAVALMVNEIIGEREIVIKPLQAPLTNVKFVSGGTLSGSGQAILVLNPADLINEALHIKTSHHIAAKKEKPKKTTARPHILVVDDSITTRTMEKNVLEAKNYEVTVAVNGKEAWDMLQKQQFSLLITDVSMPIMDGFALAEHVKNSAELHELPVIIVTSMDSAADKKRGVDVGADAYIVKSEFESDALIKIVEQLIS
jgi:two-component system chemotaxis sensor kinase CheA